MKDQWAKERKDLIAQIILKDRMLNKAIEVLESMSRCSGTIGVLGSDTLLDIEMIKTGNVPDEK